MSFARPGIRVATTLMVAVVVLTVFTLISGAIAIFSFNQFHNDFDQMASTQSESMIAAAKLQRDSEALAGFAPSLYAKGLDQSTLLQFSIAVYTQQAKLQALIDELAKYVGETDSIKTIKATSTALFRNIEVLSTSIFA